MDVTVSYDHQEAKLQPDVFKGAGPSLFGCNWLSVIRPNCESINALEVEPLKKVLENHGALLKEGLRMPKDMKPRFDPLWFKHIWFAYSFISSSVVCI